MRGVPAILEAPALVAAATAVAVAGGFVLVEVGPAAALLLVLTPAIAVAGVYLLTSGQVVLYVAAVALPMTTLGGPPLAGSLYVQDILVALAFAAWVFATFLGRGQVPAIPRTPVLGWPFVLFAAAILSATLRGHYAYGAGLIGQPLRLVLGAAIIAGLAGMTVPRMFRLLPLVFYPGAILLALLAVYFLATGGSGTDQSQLSTGGTRLLPVSAGVYAAAALFLALLNLRLAAATRVRLLHASVAAIAMFSVVAAFGRAVYAAVALVGFVCFVTSRRLRSTVFSIVPLALPFLAVLAIVIYQLAPDYVDSVQDRFTSNPETDVNVQWRAEANNAVLEQFREQPLYGVGFGKGSEFFLRYEDPTSGLQFAHRIAISQDPHNGYVFLLAGGGIFALGTFVLLLATFAFDAVRRYRSNTDPRARLIIAWAAATLFAFLVDAAAAPSFSIPQNILTIWALLVLPSVVPRSADVMSRGTHAQDESGRSSKRPEAGLRKIESVSW